MPGMPHMAMKKAAGITVTVTNDSTRHEITLRLGPWNLPGRSGMNVAQAPDLHWTVPFDGWFTTYHPRLVDASGNPLPGRLLHHVAVYDTDHANFLCRGEPEHIFGAGGELADWPAIPGLGYRVRQGEKILISTMFHNDTAICYPQTYLEIEIEYQPLTTVGPELLGVRPVWFDVKECGNSSYDLKPGRNVTSGEFTLDSSGRLMGLGGHLHDYGEELTLEDDTTHRQIAHLEAKLDAEGHLISIPVVQFTQERGLPLAKGDVMKVTAVYDNPTRKYLPDSAMGIMVGYFLPFGEGDYGTPSRPKMRP
ncbi:MAG TPA: hypothetical protein VMT20_02160 [Terriglobia bacterium]|nr:hypothetical protein [Terriglobia bacterium]